jgi:anti-sigma factor RsiW
MTAQDHDRWGDSVAAWVLGALPEQERIAFESHLASCAICRDEEAELRLAASALPGTVAQVAPDPALRDRIMRVVEAEAELLAAAGPAADRPAPRRSWRLPRLVPAGLVAAALAAGVVVTVLGDDTTTVPAQVVASGGTARVEISGDSARLVAAGLPAPPAGRVYQVWLQRGTRVEPTDALFSVTRDGRASVALPDVDGVDKVMVTDEPRQGSERPTGKLLLSAAT